MDAKDVEPEWSDLRLLLAFREQGTLQAVASTQGVTASTVSRRIRALEERVGVRLVEDVAGRLALTNAGRQAVATASRMRAQADELLRTIAGRDDKVRGTIRVGLLEVFVRYHGEAFVAFQKAHPQITLHLLVDGARLHRLTQREADVVLRVARSPRDTLVGRPVLTLQYAPFAARALADQPIETLPWIGWDSSLGASQTESWLQARVPPEHIAARVTTVVSMLDLAQVGLGACVVPVRYGRAAGLTQLTDPIDGFEVPLWVLTHRDLAASARVAALTDFLGRYFASLRATPSV